MTLFDLAKKNMIGNVKNYLLYFISMIFSVVIYYTFVSLQYSPEVKKAIESSDSILNIFIAGSVVLVLFVAIFIFYSNSFFTKKRKKEVGLYSLLGLRKKTIGKMLFYENIIMGGIAVMIGIIVGTILSKLFTLIVLRLLNAPVEVSFGISLDAIVNTFIVFLMISLFTSFRAYRLIYRFKLIELFRAEKEGEKVPKISFIAALTSIILIALSYWLGYQPPTNNIQVLTNLLLFLFCIVLGTYLLFRFLTIYLLRLLQNKKTSYYKGTNLVGISQLIYRINGNARTLTMIALLSAVTISAISVGYSFYYTNEKQAEKEAPFSYMHISTSESVDKQIEDVIQSDREHSFIGQMDIPVIHVNGEVSSPLLQDYLKNGPIKIISENTYNEALKIVGKESNIQLTGNQTIGIRPLLTEYTSNDFEEHLVTLQLPNTELDLAFSAMVEDRILPWSYPDFAIVVSNQMFSEIAAQVTPVTIKAYEVAGEKTTKDTTVQLQKLASEEMQLITYYNIYRKGLESGGLNLFILGFLGLVFLAATGCIIYFKQITESHEDRSRYKILRKIGVSKKEVNAVIRKQMMFVFGLPLIIGVVHGLVILQIASNIFSVLIGTNLTVPIVITTLLYFIIYLSYYLLTLTTVKKTVNN
ncbi:FtsX-like permease family protein [Bacillus nitroreducens]